MSNTHTIKNSTDAFVNLDANGKPDYGKYYDLVELCHTLLDQAKVPSALGAVCDDPTCQSALYHRIKTLIQQRDTIRDQTINQMNQAFLIAKEARRTIEQMEQDGYIFPYD